MASDDLVESILGKGSSSVVLSGEGFGPSREVLEVDQDVLVSAGSFRERADEIRVDATPRVTDVGKSASHQ